MVQVTSDRIRCPRIHRGWVSHKHQSAGFLEPGKVPQVKLELVELTVVAFVLRVVFLCSHYGFACLVVLSAFALDAAHNVPTRSVLEVL